MYCIRCQNDVAYCTCPDIAERLKAIGDKIAQATCGDCGKHIDLCECPDGYPTNPQMMSGTKDAPEWIPMSKEHIEANGYQTRHPWEPKPQWEVPTVWDSNVPLWRRVLNWVRSL